MHARIPNTTASTVPLPSSLTSQLYKIQWQLAYDEGDTTDRAGYFFKSLAKEKYTCRLKIITKKICGRQYVGGKDAYVRLLQKNSKP
jgi:hypothetical protein